MEKGTVALISVVIIIIGFAIVVYNGIVRKRNTVESAWSNIDVQLQRRFDLIPNLVESVRAYAKHERELFERIAVLRTTFERATSPKEIGEIDQQMSLAVKRLFAIAEGYPDLKASQNFLMLQESLAGTENRIAYSRNNYNHAVMSYNTAIQTFPGVLFAGLFGFRLKEFFEAEDSLTRENVKVEI
ncbi:MAG TPA: LemA family protein [Anaerovoracaceae bacterium]|nr:LemA family protein [Anaerovoracaceae bacterium]